MNKFYGLLPLLFCSLGCAKEFEYPEVAFIEPVNLKNQTSKIILGEPNFEKIRTLKNETKIFNTARRIASIILKNNGELISYCSGSLVGPDLILTNEHCLMDGEKMYINMEYLEEKDLGNYQAEVVSVVKKSRELDYALLRLNKSIGNHYGWLELANDTPSKGDVMIIQHPQGRDKEISRVQSSIFQKSPVVLHYFADTEGGSSGSPVFNLNGNKIVALHHAGLCEEKSDDRRRCLSKGVNEGMVIGNIKTEIKEFLPPCALDGAFPGEFVNKCAYISEY